MTIRIEAAGRTHVGLVRGRNEDGLHVGRWLLAVADGLGGHVAGDIASGVVIDALREHDQLVDPAGLPAALGSAIRAGNDALRRRVDADPALAGMGSTLVALMWSGTTAVVASVGDSRAYRLRGGVVRRLTEDHTYGRLVAEAARVPNLPERLSRWLDGRTDGRSPDITIHALLAGDRFLLCSDGLSSHVPADVIGNALAAPISAGDAADRLVQAALDVGAPDNVTVIVIDAEGLPAEDG
jgi:protein phosphatase